MTISQPITVIDIEASGLGPYTYPIEIGIAHRALSGGTLYTWESLIRPASVWVTEYDWIESCQDIHGMTPSDLKEAPQITDVIDAMETFLDGMTSLISDNPFHDNRWLETLYQQDAKGRKPPKLHWPTDLDRNQIIGARENQKHRAREDATQILLEIEKARKQ